MVDVRMEAAARHRKSLVEGRPTSNFSVLRALAASNQERVCQGGAMEQGLIRSTPPERSR